MNWAKGGTRTGRGASVKGSLDYILHDKDELTDERVGEVEMLNLFTDDPKRAWREMQTTIDAAAAIKARNGIAQTGSRNQRPVYAFALSWHPDDKPDAKHMMKTAHEVIVLLGMQHHQAVIARHLDRPHPHVHIVINMVNPDTGRTASTYRDEAKLDRWAHEYEVRQDTIRSFHRAAKYQERQVAQEPVKKSFDQALAAKTVKVEAEKKKTGLSAKHQEAARGRQDELKIPWKAYREARKEIVEYYQSLLDALRKPKAPALEIPAPSVGRPPEWKILARAMLSSGMATARAPVNRDFRQALSKVSPAPTDKVLSRKFTKVREGVDVMLPIRNTREAREFAKIHLLSRSPKTLQVEAQVKFLRNRELAAAAEAYKLASKSVAAEHKKQMKAERLEVKALTIDLKKSREDLRNVALEDRERIKAEFQHSAKKKAPEKESVKDQFQNAARDIEDRQSTRLQVREELTEGLWKKGNIDGLDFDIKVHDRSEPGGVNDGNISKLILARDGIVVAHYDHEWVTKPEPEDQSLVNLLIDHYSQSQAEELETSPEGIEAAPEQVIAEQPTREQAAADLLRQWEAAADLEQGDEIER